MPVASVTDTTFPMEKRSTQNEKGLRQQTSKIFWRNYSARGTSFLRSQKEEESDRWKEEKSGDNLADNLLLLFTLLARRDFWGQLYQHFHTALLSKMCRDEASLKAQMVYFNTNSISACCL